MGQTPVKRKLCKPQNHEVNWKWGVSIEEMAINKTFIRSINLRFPKTLEKKWSALTRLEKVTSHFYSVHESTVGHYKSKKNTADYLQLAQEHMDNPEDTGKNGNWTDVSKTELSSFNKKHEIWW